jgi:hypothetical protein
MSSRDVEEAVIRPMQRAYSPPRHLRYYDADDPGARDEALRQYYDALAGYDRDTLHRAWQKVRAEHEYNVWPTPAKLVQAAELCLPRPRPPSETEQKRQRAWERAEAYADQFMKRRQLAKVARRDGWAGELRGYVQAAAWVQAQLMEGLEKEGISLPSELSRAGSYRSSREALVACQEAFAGPVAAGEIDVQVPTGHIEQWKRQAAERRPMPPNPLVERVLQRIQERDRHKPQRSR